MHYFGSYRVLRITILLFVKYAEYLLAGSELTDLSYYQLPTILEGRRNMFT